MSRCLLLRARGHPRGCQPRWMQKKTKLVGGQTGFLRCCLAFPPLLRRFFVWVRLLVSPGFPPPPYSPFFPFLFFFSLCLGANLEYVGDIMHLLPKRGGFEKEIGELFDFLIVPQANLSSFCPPSLPFPFICCACEARIAACARRVRYIPCARRVPCASPLAAPPAPPVLCVCVENTFEYIKQCKEMAQASTVAMPETPKQHFYHLVRQGMERKENWICI